MFSRNWCQKTTPFSCQRFPFIEKCFIQKTNIIREYNTLYIIFNDHTDNLYTMCCSDYWVDHSLEGAVPWHNTPCMYILLGSSPTRGSCTMTSIHHACPDYWVVHSLEGAVPWHTPCMSRLLGSPLTRGYYNGQLIQKYFQNHGTKWKYWLQICTCEGLKLKIILIFVR